MTQQQKMESRRVRLGPIASEIARQEAGDGKIEQEHLEAALLKLQAAAKAPSVDAAGSIDQDVFEDAMDAIKDAQDATKDAIMGLAIDVAHFRYMLLACLAPNDEALQAELELANEQINAKTQKTLTEKGIPTEERERAIDQFRLMSENAKADREPELEEER